MRFHPISHIQATAIPQNHPPQHRFRRNATVAFEVRTSQKTYPIKQRATDIVPHFCGNTHKSNMTTLL